MLAATVMSLAKGDARHTASDGACKQCQSQAVVLFSRLLPIQSLARGRDQDVHVSMGMKQPNKDSCHGRASAAAGAVTRVESAKAALKRPTQSLTSFWSTMFAWAALFPLVAIMSRVLFVEKSDLGEGE